MKIPTLFFLLPCALGASPAAFGSSGVTQQSSLRGNTRKGQEAIRKLQEPAPEPADTPPEPAPEPADTPLEPAPEPVNTPPEPADAPRTPPEPATEPENTPPEPADMPETAPEPAPEPADAPLPVETEVSVDDVFHVYFQHADTESGATVYLLRKNADNPYLYDGIGRERCDTAGCRIDLFHQWDPTEGDCDQYFVNVTVGETLDPSTSLQVSFRGVNVLTVTGGFDAGRYNFNVPCSSSMEETMGDGGMEEQNEEEEQQQDEVEEEQQPPRPIETTMKVFLTRAVSEGSMVGPITLQLERNSRPVKKPKVCTGPCKQTITYKAEGTDWCREMRLRLAPLPVPVKAPYPLPGKDGASMEVTLGEDIIKSMEATTQKIAIEVTFGGKRIFRTQTTESKAIYSFKCPRL